MKKKGDYTKIGYFNDYDKMTDKEKETNLKAEKIKIDEEISIGITNRKVLGMKKKVLIWIQKELRTLKNKKEHEENTNIETDLEK